MIALAPIYIHCRVNLSIAESFATSSLSAKALLSAPKKSLTAAALSENNPVPITVVPVAIPKYFFILYPSI